MNTPTNFLSIAAATAIMVVVTIPAQAALFLETFESYAPGTFVLTDDVAAGGQVVDGYQSPLDSPGDTKAMSLGFTGADTNARPTLTQGATGDYRYQFDSATVYNGSGIAGSTQNQVLFARWGGNTNIYVNLESLTVATNTSYALKYYNGSAWANTGVVIADDAWHRYRLEWNATDANMQRLYVDNVLAASGQLTYGTIAAPEELTFMQHLTNNYAFVMDNIAFDTGTGPIPISTTIPEPSSFGMAACAAVVVGLMARRRRRAIR